MYLGRERRSVKKKEAKRKKRNEEVTKGGGVCNEWGENIHSHYDISP